MICDLYDKTISVKRLATTSGNKKSFSEVLTDISANIQPLDNEATENVDYIMGKDFQMFCELVDLREGDRVDDGTHEYKVIGVEKYDFPNIDSEPHIEATIRIFDNV